MGEVAANRDLTISSTVIRKTLEHQLQDDVVMVQYLVSKETKTASQRKTRLQFKNDSQK